MNTGLLGNTLEPLMQGVSVNSVVVGSALLIGLVFFIMHHKFELKPVFFYLMGSLVFLVTTVLIISTSVLQINSDTAGAAHTQAEIEFWVCGTELQPITQALAADRRFSQDAKRLYVSGFTAQGDTTSSLSGYISALGGEIQKESLRLPLAPHSDNWKIAEDLRDGDPQGDLSTRFMQRFLTRQSPTGNLLEITNGQRCPNTPGTELQVFVYSADPQTNSYQQRKLDSLSQHAFTNQRTLPPGDCVIVEFDKPRDTTDKLCPSYGMRDNQRCATFGINQLEDGYCSYEQINRQEESN